MPTQERSIIVNAPPEKVDAILVDPAQSREVWGSGSARPENNWPEVGGKLYVQSKLAGIDLNTTLTVLEREPSKRHRQQMEGVFTGVMTWTFTPTEGGSKLTMSADYDLPAGALGKVVDKLVLERAATNMVEKAMQTAKTRAEENP